MVANEPYQTDLTSIFYTIPPPKLQNNVSRINLEQQSNMTKPKISKIYTLVEIIYWDKVHNYKTIALTHSAICLDDDKYGRCKQLILIMIYPQLS